MMVFGATLGACGSNVRPSAASTRKSGPKPQFSSKYHLQLPPRKVLGSLSRALLKGDIGPYTVGSGKLEYGSGTLYAGSPSFLGFEYGG